MDATNWQKQTPDQPLFPDLLWSRPENKSQAGKLLIVGGNSHSFAAPASTYSQAVKAGAGTVRVLLPGSLQKTIGQAFEAGEYAPSTPSGGFSQAALSELLDLAAWADSVLLTGDFGRNSETAILLEHFIKKYSGQLTLSQDAVDYFLDNATSLLERPETLIVPSFNQLQKMGTSAGCTIAITHRLDFLHFIEALQAFTRTHHACIALRHLETYFVGVDGRVSSTKPAPPIQEVNLAARAAVWWLQNPSQTFAALTTSLVAD